MQAKFSFGMTSRLIWFIPYSILLTSGLVYLFAVEKILTSFPLTFYLLFSLPLSPSKTKGADGLRLYPRTSAVSTAVDYGYFGFL